MLVSKEDHLFSECNGFEVKASIFIITLNISHFVKTYIASKNYYNNYFSVLFKRFWKGLDLKSDFHLPKKFILFASMKAA